MKTIMILSVLIMIPNWAVAVNSNIAHTHTNTPIELEFVSSNSAPDFKLAGVCFLGTGDCGGGSFGKGDEDMTIDSAKQCIDGGYEKTSCPLPTYLSDACPYNDGYFAQCVEDKKRACEEAGFGDVACEVGEVSDVACPYDSSYKKCKCNLCEDFTYNYVEATTQGYVSDGSCQSCEESKYKRKENPCSGYQTCECGGEIGANVCYTGSMKKFNTCKTCCAYGCSLSSCPSNASCSYESCSGRYCMNGCNSGFKLVSGSCIPPRASCAIGWIYYVDGTCVTPAAHNSSKVALGVVVHVNPDGIGGQVMAARDLGKMYWSTEHVDIAGLPNFSYEDASRDYNSCSNTDKIIAQGGSSTYPAAHAARSYNPTTETMGKWCLLAAGIMTNIFNNQSAVQAGIAKLGGTAFQNYTWSSSEYYGHYAWGSHFNNRYGLYYYGTKYEYNYFVRPVLEF